MLSAVFTPIYTSIWLGGSSIRCRDSLGMLKIAREDVKQDKNKTEQEEFIAGREIPVADNIYRKIKNKRRGPARSETNKNFDNDAIPEQSITGKKWEAPYYTPMHSRLKPHAEEHFRFETKS